MGGSIFTTQRKVCHFSADVLAMVTLLTPILEQGLYMSGIL